MTYFWDNPDPFLLFIVLGFTRRMIKLKLRGNIAKSDNQNVNSVRFWRVQSMDERTQTSDLFKNQNLINVKITTIASKQQLYLHFQLVHFEMAERPEDLNLPTSIVTKIIKDCLPNTCKVSKEANAAIAKV